MLFAITLDRCNMQQPVCFQKTVIQRRFQTFCVNKRLRNPEDNTLFYSTPIVPNFIGNCYVFNLTQIRFHLRSLYICRQGHYQLFSFLSFRRLILRNWFQWLQQILMLERVHQLHLADFSDQKSSHGLQLVPQTIHETFTVCYKSICDCHSSNQLR